MKDKEIIIDCSQCKDFGIRASEGKQFGWCHYYDDHCEDFVNCNFKQLKCKEQECEELKKSSAYWGRTCARQEHKIRQYKQALEKIDNIADENLCDDDCDECPDDCICDWKEIKDIINKAKENK